MTVYGRIFTPLSPRPAESVISAIGDWVPVRQVMGALLSFWGSRKRGAGRGGKQLSEAVAGGFASDDADVAVLGFAGSADSRTSGGKRRGATGPERRYVRAVAGQRQPTRGDVPHGHFIESGRAEVPSP